MATMYRVDTRALRKEDAMYTVGWLTMHSCSTLKQAFKIINEMQKEDKKEGLSGAYAYRVIDVHL